MGTEEKKINHFDQRTQALRSDPPVAPEWLPSGSPRFLTTNHGYWCLLVHGGRLGFSVGESTSDTLHFCRGRCFKKVDSYLKGCGDTSWNNGVKPRMKQVVRLASSLFPLFCFAKASQMNWHSGRDRSRSPGSMYGTSQDMSPFAIFQI